jgi:CubicO group peptidase (beta-lactamase class C family)
MRVCLKLGVVLFHILTLASPAAIADDAPLEGILRQSLDAWHAPGIAAAIVREDETQFVCVGVRQQGRTDRVTPDTLFAIGSCTKAFTATALAMLVAEGKADWEDPVRKHLPWFHLDDPLADRDVRLRDLLCHRIGLGRHDLLWYRAPWSIEDSVRRLGRLESSTSFRSTFEYNNLAYLAAGLAIESIAKQPWHDFVREKLFKPLAMPHAGFTSGEAERADNHASPYGQDAEGKVVRIPWYNDDKQIRASGSIKANVRDLSRWLRFQLNHGKIDNVQVLAEEALAETHAPHIPVPLSAANREAAATQASYGLGWIITEYRGHAILGHGGAVEGFRARIILVPRKKLGLVLLTNLEEMEIVDAAGNNLLDHLLGLKAKDWNGYFQSQHRKAEDENKQRREKRLGKPVRGTKTSRDLEAYVGSFSEPAYGTVEVSLDDGKLLLCWSSFRLPLTHFHYDTFVTPRENRRVPSALWAETAVFELNERAEVATLHFLGRVFKRVNIQKNLEVEREKKR